MRKLMDSETHRATAYHGRSLAYNHQGEVGMMIERTWSEAAGGGPDCESHTLGRGTEFLGNGRTRYGVRQREFVEDPFGFWYWSIVEGTTLWSDYDGDEIHGDYKVTATKTWDEQEQVWVYGPPELHNVAAYLPGIGQMDSQTGAVTYYHADHLGTLRATTDGAGLVSSGLVLTAFGETVAVDGTVGTRYQYAGTWGYESALGSPGNGGASGQTGLPWQHVGHRWYDPSTGRFLQRDPIGIRGGLNVYEYVRNLPTGAIDPLGLIFGSFGCSVNNNYYYNAPPPPEVVGPPEPTLGFTGQVGPTGPTFGAQFQAPVSWWERQLLIQGAVIGATVEVAKDAGKKFIIKLGEGWKGIPHPPWL